MSIQINSLIRLPEVLAQTGYNKSDWYRVVREGIAPEPIRRGRISLWSQKEISDFIQKEIQEAPRGLRQGAERNVKNRALRDAERVETGADTVKQRRQ